MVWQFGLSDLLLCSLKRIGNAIECKATFRIINHESGPWIPIARLSYPSWVNNCTVSFWYLPFAFRWKDHLVCDVDHALAQAQKARQLFNFFIETLFGTLDGCFWRNYFWRNYFYTDLFLICNCFIRDWRYIFYW